MSGFSFSYHLPKGLILNRIHPVAFAAITALISWIGFRVFGVFGFLAIVALVVLFWYLLQNRPELLGAARQSVSKVLSGGAGRPENAEKEPRNVPAAFSDGPPLDGHERAQFSDLVDSFHAPSSTPRNRPRRAGRPDSGTSNPSPFFGGALSGETSTSSGSGSCASQDGGSSSGSSSSSSSSDGGGGGGCD